MQDVWTVSELAVAAGLSEGHIRLLLKRGEIKASKLGRHMWMIADEEATRFLEQRGVVTDKSEE